MSTINYLPALFLLGNNLLCLHFSRRNHDQSMSDNYIFFMLIFEEKYHKII